MPKQTGRWERLREGPSQRREEAGRRVGAGVSAGTGWRRARARDFREVRLPIEL